MFYIENMCVYSVYKNNSVDYIFCYEIYDKYFFISFISIFIVL